MLVKSDPSLQLDRYIDTSHPTLSVHSILISNLQNHFASIPVLKDKTIFHELSEALEIPFHQMMIFRKLWCWLDLNSSDSNGYIISLSSAAELWWIWFIFVGNIVRQCTATHDFWSEHHVGAYSIRHVNGIRTWFQVQESEARPHSCAFDSTTADSHQVRHSM